MGKVVAQPFHFGTGGRRKLAGIFGDGGFKVLTDSAVEGPGLKGAGTSQDNQPRWAADERDFRLLDETYLRRIYLMACENEKTSQARNRKNCAQKETSLSGDASLHSGQS